LSRRRDLEPTFNGPTSRIRRIGSRWSIGFELPPMSYVDALAWVSALTAAEGDTVIMRLSQPGLVIGGVGAPLVNGAGQLGAVINLDGFAANYQARAGQWFNLSANGRIYLYQIAAARTATAGGVMAAMPISPMIRRSAADNSAVEFANPVIEGFANGDAGSWTTDAAQLVGLSFTITERE
jgi:hypothetical protein